MGLSAGSAARPHSSLRHLTPASSPYHVRNEGSCWVSAMLRSKVKSVVERLAVHSGAVGLARTFWPSRVYVLAYHNVLPAGAEPVGEGALHLSLGSFIEQIETLRLTHDVVPLQDVLRNTSRSARPRAAITFDDGYRGAVNVALPELAARGMPATVFIAPGLVGDSTSWWDSLADPASGTLTPLVRTQALDALRGEGRAVLAWARERGLPIMAIPPYGRVVTEGELQAAGRLPGITFGAHSWGHPNLTSLSGDGLRQELERPLKWLRERLPGTIPWLAYPYGLWSPAVASATADAGYTGALRIEGGWFTPGLHPCYALPRFNIPAGLSIQGFVLRTSGVFRG